MEQTGAKKVDNELQFFPLCKQSTTLPVTGIMIHLTNAAISLSKVAFMYKCMSKTGK